MRTHKTDTQIDTTHLTQHNTVDYGRPLDHFASDRVDDRIDLEAARGSFSAPPEAARGSSPQPSSLFTLLVRIHPLPASPCLNDSVRAPASNGIGRRAESADYVRI